MRGAFLRRIITLFLLFTTLIFPSVKHPEEPNSLRPENKNSEGQAAGQCIAASWHYESVPGKLIGIWPPGYNCTAEGYKNFKNKYGFSGVAVVQTNYSKDGPYQKALDAGFRPENMMIMTYDTTYISAVKELPAGYYYLDEPVEHDCAGHATNKTRIYPPDELTKRRDYVHSIRSDSKFVIGGYKRCSHLKIAAGCADNIMYTSYVNWSSLWLPVCHVNMGFGDEYEAGWMEGSSLQLGSWQDMRSTFKEKFSMSWMHGKDDDYKELFAAANSLGLQGIWIYALEGMGPDSAATLERICQAAVDNGWMKKVDDFIPAPLNLVPAKAPDGVSVALSWQDISDNEAGFIIERKLSSSENYAQIASVGSGNVSFTDSTVEEGKVYNYRIRAFSSYNTSDYSNTAVISAPLRPHTLSPEDKAKDQPLKINFNWSPLKDAESYILLIAEDFLFAGTVQTDTLSSSAPGHEAMLKDGRRYFWKVYSVDASKIKTCSAPGSFTTLLSAPENLKAQASGNKIKLTWVDRSQSETGFYLERKAVSDSVYMPLAVLKENTASFTDSLLEASAFRYRIRAFNDLTQSAFSSEADAAVITAAGQKEILPVDYALFQNHPNPYNPSTRIAYTLPFESRVRLLIYSSIGDVVRTLVDGIEGAGLHELDFNAAGLSSGIYFYTMEASATGSPVHYRSTKKMLLLK